MNYVITISAILVALSFGFNSYAQQDINHYCKAECGAKGGSLGKCNAICSTTDESGNRTKDPECLSSCLKKGYTAYICYSSCHNTGGKDTGAGSNSNDSNSPASTVPR
ncbi:MAG: hypothetical protein A4E65_01512 [Syntrophorhabdus sp. PtaU1.Bin153]|nr:MAG: hypothetical protein A4E65_01512 [Syntrophorhabdus sp. PtaU1.Bin153]